VDKGTVLANRLERHRLLAPVASEEDYLVLLRQLQPVNPIYYTCPGDPPSLSPRAAFDDQAVTASLRRKQVLTKGRFLGGGVGYVLADELALFANAFCKPLTSLGPREREILEVIKGAGPLSAGLIKEETGLLSKEIMPVLHKLQKAFIIYEDQSDSDWERPWEMFDRVWPDVLLSLEQQLTAVKTILSRFIRINVFLTLGQLKSWSRLPARLLKAATQALIEEQRIVQMSVAGLGEGYMLPNDVDLAPARPQKSVFMLHKADPMVRTHLDDLKTSFDGEVLQYLLIDGDLAGAVMGHVRIGAHDVDDIKLQLPKSECAARRAEILNVVAKHYAPPRSRIQRYCGQSLTQ
jgi:hypothetical protein